MGDLDEVKAALDAASEDNNQVEKKPRGQKKDFSMKQGIELKKEAAYIEEAAKRHLVHDFYLKGVKFEVEKEADDVILPYYKRPGDACLDVHAYKFLSLKNEMGVEMIKEGDNPESITLHQGWIAVVSSGIKCKLEKGWGMDVKIRSGVGKEGVILLNAPGKVDTLYTGTVCMMVTKVNKVPFVITKGDRIAQIEPVEQIFLEWTVVDKVETEENNTRGEQGLGSSGIK